MQVYTFVKLKHWLTLFLLISDRARQEDYSAFSSPFVEAPRVIGRNLYSKYPDFHIPVPITVRNYLDRPDPQILSSMQLPYPFRIKEPVSQRAVRMDSNDPFVKAMGLRQNADSPLGTTKKHSEKRHTLSLGQVDRLLNAERQEPWSVKFLPEHEGRVKNSYNPYKRSHGLSDKEAQEIAEWIPEQSEWENDWAEETYGGSSNPFKSPSSPDSNNADLPLLHIPTASLDKSPGNQHA